MGAAWAQDAFTQSALTLHSCRLASEFLVPGGTFITKVFRSADYHALLYVFNQVFPSHSLLPIWRFLFLGVTVRISSLFPVCSSLAAWRRPNRKLRATLLLKYSLCVSTSKIPKLMQ